MAEVSKEITQSHPWRDVQQERGRGKVCGMQAEEAGIINTEWSQKDHVVFSQVHSHQIGMVGDKTGG